MSATHVNAGLLVVVFETGFHNCPVSKRIGVALTSLFPPIIKSVPKRDRKLGMEIAV